MAVPKKKTSKARRDRRRANHDKISQPAISACVECGALFGVRSTVERIMEKLAGSHPMFASSDQARMIQMCDDCRVKSQFARGDNPFQGGERPRVRTSEDYFSKRKDH